MADFTLRSDQIDVEQIMRQIRARIKEKRGVDYTEEEIRELANVKLERFLDPRALRADLVKHFRRQHAAQPLPALPPVPPLENYAFDADTIYKSHRGPLRWVRRLLNPLLKLFFNPNPLIHALHLQGRMNAQLVEHLDVLHRQLDVEVNRRFMGRDEVDALHYEVITNLVLELTRLGIENRNLKMRVESLSTRLDFDERRARALEGVVQYRPGALTPPVAEPGAGEPPEPAEAAGDGGDAGRTGKRRRRRRGRRRGPGEDGGGSGDGTAREDGADGAPQAADAPPAATGGDQAPSAAEGGDADRQ